MDLTQGRPIKQIILFALPLVVGTLFQQLYSFVDTVMVGRLVGDAALAAVGTTWSLYFFTIGFVQGSCAGFCIPLAQSIGAKDMTEFKRYFWNGVWVCIVMAVVVATAVRIPEFQVSFMFIGTVRLKYVALFVVLIDLLFVTSGNGGGHIAHLGGALAGWWFASSLAKGHDLTQWINKCLDLFSGSFHFKKTSKKPKMKVDKGGKAADYDYNARKKQQNDEIDRILDKLKQSGYSSLTTEEKKRLFDASKK